MKRDICKYGPAEFNFKEKFKPLEVKVEGSSREDFEYAYRKFKSLFQKERIIGILKEKSFFEKPSEKKRRKAREAKERNFIANQKAELMKNGEWDKLQKKKFEKEISKAERRAKQELGEDV